ncbi:MAG: glucose-6-phosphate isomerase, partial [Clostridia bacterium]
EQIVRVAANVRAKYENFVVLGIGGSALGPIAVQQALNHLHYNDLPAEKRNGPRLFVEDNIDPERMAALLDVIDVRKTCFNIITKSGATAETMSQYLIISERLKQEVGAGWAAQMIATTDTQRGNLIKLAKQEGFETFYIPNGVGGRFSELCPVGLLPAAVCGIDVRALLHGAAMMDEVCKSENLWENPALLEASLQYIAMQEMDVNIQVMMPYADSLKTMADWFCQLWAESLGKNVTRKGMAVNYGQTPVKSLGVTDQHSQLQLYTEGPYDKIITLMQVEKFRAETVIPHGCEEFPDVAFLGGKTHNQLIEAERAGTEYALYRAGRMSQTITLPEVNACTIGQLLYFFEMTTAYAGELLDIDAFNQPGVEESKIASFAVLGHEGEKFAKKRYEMQTRPERLEKYRL